jgi:hypothetical protein
LVTAIKGFYVKNPIGAATNTLIAMTEPLPNPGGSLPSAVETFRAVQSVRRPVEGFLTAVSQLLAMPRDRRYVMSVVCRLGVPGIGIGLVCNFLFWNYLFAIPLIAPLSERLIVAGLAMGWYAILVRELGRYRAVLSYIEQFGPPGVSPRA